MKCVWDRETQKNSAGFMWNREEKRERKKKKAKKTGYTKKVRRGNGGIIEMEIKKSTSLLFLPIK